ncbi:MAG: YjjG family noncanonical pyrimidine nucleotidase, partial [Ruminococcus sp.]|nr:YjjG family noncanonical pyrimidine nucleotidase [Ruminococcus sp.]
MSDYSGRRKRFDVVLLDADETIFDFKRAEAHSLKQLLLSLNLDPSAENVKLYSAINLSMWKALERGEIEREKLKSLRFERFFSEINACGIDPVKANDQYLTNLSNSTFLIDGAEHFVKKLSQYCKVYFATNGLTKAQTGRFSQSAIKDDFDGAFISEQIGFAKPDKAYFDYIFDSLNIKDKSRVIMIGDSLSSDM